MRYILKPLKIAGFILLVVTFLTISFAVDLAVRNEKSKRLYFSRISSFYMKMALSVLGVRVNVINPERLAPGRGSFLVSNHLSYIDVFAIFSNVPAVFVANSELEEAFLLGTIIKYSGGVFVERRGRARLVQGMEGITGMLDLGLAFKRQGRDADQPLYRTEVTLDRRPALHPVTLHGNAVVAFAHDEPHSRVNSTRRPPSNSAIAAVSSGSEAVESLKAAMSSRRSVRARFV